jgi:hypothetical protein
MRLAARNGKTEIWIPQGFDARECLPARLWKHRDEINAVISHIATTKAMLFNPDASVWLRHEDASYLIGDHRRWDKTKDACLDSGIFGCDNLYDPGRKSMGYWLLPPWDNVDLEPVTIRNADVAARITLFENRRSRREHWQPVHFHLESYLQPVTIDEQKATRYLCRPSSPKQYYARKTVALIKAGDPRASLSRHGRFYSYVTQCQRTLRPYLRVDDLKLVEMDIANCQPYLLGLMCMHSLFAGMSEEKKKRKKKAEARDSRVSLYMSYKNAPIMHSCAPSDLARHNEACAAGEYYEQLAEVLKKPCRRGAESGQEDVLSAGVRGPAAQRSSMGRVCDGIPDDRHDD